jgi:hypothetical protein
MKRSRSLTFHEHIRLLRIIFFLLLGAQGLFFLIAWFLQDSVRTDGDLKGVLDYLVPLFMFTSIFASRFLYRSLISKARLADFSSKIKQYRIAVIAVLAILEGANLMAIIALMLTGEYLYAAASVIMFLLFILNAPSEERFRMDLELTNEELSYTE